MSCRWRKARCELSVVHPGGVATNIARNSRTGAGMTDNARRAQSIERFDAVAKTTPAAAALRIIEGIEKNAPRILIGNDARFMDLLQRLRPGTYWAVLARRIEKMRRRSRDSSHARPQFLTSSRRRPGPIRRGLAVKHEIVGFARAIAPRYGSRLSQGRQGCAYITAPPADRRNSAMVLR